MPGAEKVSGYLVAYPGALPVSGVGFKDKLVSFLASPPVLAHALLPP